MHIVGSSVGAVVRAQWPSTNVVRVRFPGWDVICRLSLLVLYSAPRGFFPATPVLPSHQKPTFVLINIDLCLFDFLSPQLVEPLWLAKYT